MYRATLQVTDQGGRIVVGLRRDHRRPAAGGRRSPSPTDANGFQFGDTVHYSVTVTDDQPVDCNKVQVTYILGHDTHGHPQTHGLRVHRQHHHERARRARSRRPTT